MDLATLKRTRAAMVGIQLGLLAVFAVVSVVLHVLRAHALSGAPTSVEASVYVAMALALVIAFVTLHPLPERTPTPVASRVAAVLCFVASAAMALGVHAEVDARMADASAPSPSPLHVLRMWFLGLIVLLAALVVCSFAHEMARKDRSRLIRSLSSTVTCGLAGACAGGWTFLVDFRQPEELAELNPEVMAVLFVLAALAVAGMVVASTRWVDAHYHQIDMGHGYGWVSVGLLTTMFTGAVVVLLDLVMTLLWTRL